MDSRSAVDLVTIAGFILLLLSLLGVSVMMIIRAPDAGVIDKNVYLRPRPKMAADASQTP